jgi:hypothetical protein
MDRQNPRSPLGAIDGRRAHSTTSRASSITWAENIVWGNRAAPGGAAATAR